MPCLYKDRDDEEGEEEILNASRHRPRNCARQPLINSVQLHNHKPVLLVRPVQDFHVRRPLLTQSLTWVYS
jgi:hypothetical protein